ncbi:MAG: GNAT family N-acetyltransferase [Cohnella sp.]|nr:GNAT family N-acetyltransferase [Cohnella sp.]
MTHMTALTISNPSVNSRIEAHWAKPEDGPAIMELYRITAEWLKSKGSAQWADLLVGIDRHNTAAAIERGEVVLFKKGTDPAAVVILMLAPSPWDLDLWGDDPSNEKAVFLHRMCIHRDFGGTGLGAQVIRWVDAGIAYPPDKDVIRLDCNANNPILNAFYRDAGYAFVGEKDGLNLYEKRWARD